MLDIAVSSLAPTPPPLVGADAESHEPKYMVAAPPTIAVTVRQPQERHTWTATAGVLSLPLAPTQQRSQSYNQIANSSVTDDTKTKLSPLKLECMAPTVLFATASSGPQVGEASPTPTPTPPTINRTRRGSIILHATMKAMTMFVAPSPDQTQQELVSPPRDRLKSNQDSDSDSDDGDDLDANTRTNVGTNSTNSTNKQRDESPSTTPPPYFRLRTFLLDEEPLHACPPTSPTPLSPRRIAATPSKAAQIEAIFREIWHTEQSYVDALTGLVTRFFKPLQSYAKQNGIALGAMAALCHSTTTILSIHQELLRQLEPLHRQTDANSLDANTNPLDTNTNSLDTNTNSSDPFGVGFTGTLARLHLLCRAFLSTIEYMKVYAFYCGSYLSAKQELERLQRQHPRLANFTAQLNEQALRGNQDTPTPTAEGTAPPPLLLQPPLDINSNLIKPVQRICRYPLLFKSLLANASSPEETLVLQQSLQKIQAVSNYVNEKVREAQNNARLYQLHQMLHPSSSGALELLQPSRTLLHEAWANVTSLDAPRWPAKLLCHFRRRGRHHVHGHRLSSLREDWAGLSVFGLGDDRRSSATVTANILKSQASSQGSGGGGGVGGGRNTSFSNASTTGEYIAPPPRLLHRRSSGGERSRLILLSDMLLMAKLKDRQLKIRRQICLSCAVIHDEVRPPDALQAEDEDEEERGVENATLLSPPGARQSTGAATVSVVSALANSHAFTLEVSKVGRCSCHHFSPLTLKRSPRLGGLTAFLSGRRSSLSILTTAELIPTASQVRYAGEGGGGAGGVEQRPRSPSQRIGSSRSSKSGLRFRYLEHLAGIRSSKRYRISCDNPQAKAEFLRALRLAIDRSARLVSVGGGGGGGGGSATSSRVLTDSSSVRYEMKHVNLPTRIWRSLVGASALSQRSSESRGGDEEDVEEEEFTATSPVPPLSRRQRDSLTIVCGGGGARRGSVSGGVRLRPRTLREADLLHLDDPRGASVEEAIPASSPFAILI